MNKLILVLVFVFVFFQALAPMMAFAKPTLSVSQKRAPNESYEDAAERFLLTLPMKVMSGEQAPTVYEAQIDSTKINPETTNVIPQFSGLQKLKEFFFHSRDRRFMKDPMIPNFLRRITWLFPDDGCYARATLVLSELSKNMPDEKMGSVFVFGSLNAKTSNSPSGSVTWWYHVAPVARIGDQLWILDAAIEPKEPLTFESWTQRMDLTGRSFSASFCDKNAYNPGVRCFGGPDNSEAALADDSSFLDSERERLEQLNRDANKELGDLPPWQ